MPTYTIEMLWQCGTCGHRDNKGLSPKCESCGKPKDDRDLEYFPEDVSETAELSGKKLERALSGPDWICKYCETRQNKADRICYNCGCDQNTGNIYKTRDLELSEKADESNRLEFSKEDDKTNETNKLKSVGAPLLTTQLKQARTSGISRRSWILPGLVLIAALSGVVALLWWLFLPSYVEARVTAVHWSCTARYWAQRPVRYEGWQVPPGAFQVENLGQRVQSYNERDCDCRSVPKTCTKSERVCTKTNRECKSNKNGSATCTGGDNVCTGGDNICTGGGIKCRTCRDPVLAQWYSWLHTERVLTNTLTQSGDTFVVKIPSEWDKDHPEYNWLWETVFTGDDGRTYTYHPKSPEEWRSMPVGYGRQLRVNKIGFQLTPG